MSEVEPFQRLPTTVLPKNYEVSLQPDLLKCTFQGSVLIEIEIKESVKQIELNSLELTLGEVSLAIKDQTLKPSNVSLNTSKETLLLTFNETLSTGKAVLKIEFEGKLEDKMRGFYRSKYTVGTEVHYAAVTQLEATYARRCFPCWDEPAIKATFDVILTAPKDRVTLSNMNEVSYVPHPNDNSLKIVKFAKTPLMSTYLMAVVVGEFDFVENIMPSGVSIRVYTPLGQKDQGLFSLDVASKVLPYYENYFQIDYPLPKMDLIAISDFNGAMENWGLITYVETMLLVDPHNTSASQKQNIALVVGHEIAHQWFGNLVTMEWWTHLWLNEGYATFGEFLCVDHLFPEYNIWTQFLTSTLICALELDALKNSHPIEVPVGHPSEVNEIFDAISYCKGASVIRMIHNHIGDRDFRKGMSAYLSRHRYGNTSTNDLWASLSESSGKSVGNIMSSWTEKSGFPMISVSSQQDGSNRVLTFSQQRFLADGSSDPSATEWIVPISVLCSSDGIGDSKAKKECVLETKSSQLILEGVLPTDWIKLNLDFVGFYRTRYPPDMLDQLQVAISSKALPALDRLGIIDDLFAMVQAGHNSTVDVLRFLKCYEDETAYTVWSAIRSIVSQLNQLLSHTDYQPLFKTFVRRLFSKIAVKLGWEARPNESHLDTLLRPLVLQRLGTYGDESVYTEAKRRLTAHLNGTAVLPADLRSAVYETVLTEPCENTFQQMIDLYRNTELHEEKQRILIALGASSDPNFIQKVLQFSMSDDVRSQYAVFGIISVTRSNTGRLAAWSFFKDNFELLKDKYDGNYFMTKLIKALFEYFASEEMAREIEDFFLAHAVPGTERTIQQSVECVRLNAAWLKRDSDSIKRFLRDNV